MLYVAIWAVTDLEIKLSIIAYSRIWKQYIRVCGKVIVLVPFRLSIRKIGGYHAALSDYHEPSIDSAFI